MSKFKFGIMGCGSIAERFCGAVSVLQDEVCVHACAARDAQRAKTFAGKFDIPNHYPSYEAMVKAGGLDAVYVSNTHPFHFDAVKLALEHKIPVLCEKPMTVNAEDAKALFEIAKANDTFLMEAMWTRFLPLYEKLKEIVDSGRIGKIVRVNADFSRYSDFDPESRMFSMLQAGGPLIDMCIYSITFAAIFLGNKPDKIVSDLHFASTGVDDSDCIILRYPGGEQAVLTSATIADAPVVGTVLGTKGMITVESFLGGQKAALEVRGETPATIDVSYVGNGFEPEIMEVVRCVRAGKKQSDMMPVASTIEILELMDEVRRQNGLVYDCEK